MMLKITQECPLGQKKFNALYSTSRRTSLNKAAQAMNIAGSKTPPHYNDHMENLGCLYSAYAYACACVVRNLACTYS